MKNEFRHGNLSQNWPIILQRLFAGICLTFFIAHSVYGWSSTETTGVFATHQFLNDKARELLAQHPMLQKGYIYFPKISVINQYSGVGPAISGGALTIQGEGPDNPRNSDFAAHYFNPSIGKAGLGGAPKKANETYAGLKRSLIVMSGRYEDYYKENQNRIDPGYYAAYLGHFIQDMTCPFHVIGVPAGDYKYNPKAIGPYVLRYGSGIRKLPPISIDYEYFNKHPMAMSVGVPTEWVTMSTGEFWNLMIERFKREKNKDPNWFEPNYYNGSSDYSNYSMNWAWTYFSTHFLYEANVGTFHKEPSPSVNSLCPDSKEAYKELRRKWWYACTTNRAECFAKKIAEETKSRLDRGEKEFMFNPAKMSNPGQVPMPRDAWCRAVQATYTAWRASFSALFIHQYTDVQLVNVSNNPEKYKIRLRIWNMEPEEAATKVQARVIFKRGKMQYDFGKTPTVKIEKGKESGWLDCDKEVKANDLDDGMFYITVTGNYNTVPDAGETFFEYSASRQPIEGVWRLKGKNKVTEMEIKYNPEIGKHEASVVQQGVFRWHTKGTLMISSIEPLQAPVMQVPGRFDGGILYRGTERSWEQIKIAGSSEVRKGNDKRRDILLILDGNNLETRSDETRLWSKVR